ncbi:MAG: hypothetical protein ACYDG5_05835, partial [Dehalococcoidales bacterium]
LKKKSDVLPFIIVDNLYPLPFIVWAKEVMIPLVSCVLSSIDWDSISTNLPKDIQDKINESHDSYKQGLGQLLNWPEEPLYF